jgi:hypothetical protein
MNKLKTCLKNHTFPKLKVLRSKEKEKLRSTEPSIPLEKAVSLNSKL